MSTPEAIARQKIDALLEEAGWCVQDYKTMNLTARPGVAIREFPLKPGYGTCDYLLFADARPVGVVEAKPEGTTLKGVEVQTSRYSAGLPGWLDPYTRPLSIAQISHGLVDALDPDQQIAATRMKYDLPPDAEPTPEQFRTASAALQRAERMRQAILQQAFNGHPTVGCA